MNSRIPPRTYGRDAKIALPLNRDGQVSLLTSLDAPAIYRNFIPKGSANNSMYVCWAGDRWIGNVNTTTMNAAYSTDGVTWTNATTYNGSTTQNYSACMVYEGGTTLCMIPSGTLKSWVSLDKGVTWTGYAGIAIIRVCRKPGGTRWIGLASGGGPTYSDDEGQTWAAAGTVISTNPQGLIWSEYHQKYFACFGTGAIASSDDGLTWSIVMAATGTALYSMAVSTSGMLVATGASATYYTSTNGVDWTSRTGGWGSGYIALYAPNTNLFLVVQNAAGYNNFWTSQDGTNWSSNWCINTNHYGAATNGTGFFVTTYASYRGQFWPGTSTIVPLTTDYSVYRGNASMRSSIEVLNYPTVDSTLGEGGTGDFTLSFDYKMSAILGSRYVLRGGSLATANSWILYIQDNAGYSTGTYGYHFTAYGPTGAAVIDMRPVTQIPNDWTTPYRFRLTRSGSTFTMYRNGSPFGSQTSTATLPTTTGLYVGYVYAVAGAYSQSETFVTNVALTNSVVPYQPIELR